MSINLIKESERGVQAKHWLDDPMTKEAFEKVRKGIYERWAASPVEDKDGQHALRLMLKLLDDLHANVVDVAMTGQMAQAQIEHEKTMKQKAKDFLNKYGVRV